MDRNIIHRFWIDPGTSWKVGFAPAKENLDEIIGKDEIALLAL